MEFFSCKERNSIFHYSYDELEDNFFILSIYEKVVESVHNIIDE